MIDPIKIAWMAGFFDGEGYVGVIRNWDRRYQKYNYRVQVSLGQVSPFPLEVFREHFGGNLRHQKNGHQGFWEWRVTGEKAYAPMRLLAPYLIVKRRQAELILEFGQIAVPHDQRTRYRTIPENIIAHRRAIWAALVELNGGRALQAERTSEETPLMTGDAMFRSDGNNNRQSVSEMKTPPTAIQ